MVLIGDSNAGHFSESFVGAAESVGTSLHISTRSGCPFIDAEVTEGFGSSRQEACREYVERMTGELKDQRPDLVLIANSTDLYLEDASRTLIDPSTGKSTRNREEEAQVFQAALDRTSVSLAQSGITVVIIEVPPKPRNAGIAVGPDGCSPLLLWVDPDRCSFPDFSADNSLTRQANQIERQAARLSGGTSWSFTDVICPLRSCSERDSNNSVWSDDDHISVGTAKSLIPKASEYLRGIS